MKKSLLALFVASSILSLNANADVFIDDKIQDQVVSKKTEFKKDKQEVKQNLIKVKTLVKNESKKLEHKHIKQHPEKDLKTKNIIKNVETKQEVSNFEHIGKKDKMDKIKGFSNNVTIHEAIEQLVPEKWNVNVSDKVNLDKRVSFVGGKTWSETLEVIGKDNFTAVFDWNKKILIISPIKQIHKVEKITKTEKVVSKIKNVERKQIKQLASVKHVKKSEDVNKKQFVKKEIKQKTKNWLLRKDYTLRQNIEMWAKKAGWIVAWNAPDYNVISNTKLTGEIDSEDGPIITILKLYEDSNLPLKVSIMGGNKVISVESRNYIPRDSIDIGKGIY